MEAVALAEVVMVLLLLGLEAEVSASAASVMVVRAAAMVGEKVAVLDLDLAALDEQRLTAAKAVVMAAVGEKALALVWA